MFALLDPDPDPEYGPGSTGLIESGSESETLDTSPSTGSKYQAQYRTNTVMSWYRQLCYTVVCRCKGSEVQTLFCLN
jgi:hypothetical protein